MNSENRYLSHDQLFVLHTTLYRPDFGWLRLESFPEMSLLWLFIFWIHFPWFILYRENVLGCTECACGCVWFRENVLICTKCVCRGVLFRENVLDGTKNSFARKWWGIQPLIKISSPEMSPFAEDFVITDIYLCRQKTMSGNMCRDATMLV